MPPTTRAGTRSNAASAASSNGEASPPDTVYRATIVLNAVIAWIKALSDMF